MSCDLHSVGRDQWPAIGPLCAILAAMSHGPIEPADDFRRQLGSHTHSRARPLSRLTRGEIILPNWSDYATEETRFRSQNKTHMASSPKHLRKIPRRIYCLRISQTFIYSGGRDRVVSIKVFQFGPRQIFISMTLIINLIIDLIKIVSK